MRVSLRLFLLTAAIGLIAFGGLSSGGPAHAQSGLDRAVEVANQNAAILDRAGVEGIGVGVASTGGQTIRIFTTNPGVGGLPSRLGGFDVEVVVSGRFDAYADPTARFPRPVPIGVSTGHPNITAGTIGARVSDGQGNTYALSNNHVYADVNSATIGDNVLQPGPYDGGLNPADAIGALADYQPIKFGKKQTNTIDAAIAITSTDDVGNSTPADGYGTPGSQTVAATVGQSVQKYGRTTGQTAGSVSEIGISVDVCYVPAGPVGCKKSARFVGQIGVVDQNGGGNFSAGGDSGSLIVDSSLNPVALLFAGSSARTLANPIDAVLDRFGVTIDSGPTLPPNDAPVVTISSPADGSLHASGASISFAGTASDTEDIGLTAADLSWSSDIDGGIGSGGSFSATLSDGVHSITASATDSGNKTGSASVSITVGDPPIGPTTVGVASATLFTEGGKNGDKHLNVTYLAENDLGDAVAGAVVDNTLTNVSTGQSWSGSAATGASGTITFTLKNAPSGCYIPKINNVTAAGLDWDGETDPPQTPDPFCK